MLTRRLPRSLVYKSSKESVSFNQKVGSIKRLGVGSSHSREFFIKMYDILIRSVRDKLFQIKIKGNDFTSYVSEKPRWLLSIILLGLNISVI